MIWFRHEHDNRTRDDMRTNYARARDFEYRVRDDMKKHGFIAVRSPASKTPTDVYCIGYEVKVFIQCKTNGVLGPKEWNEFWDFCKSVNAIPVLAMKGKNGRGIEYKLLTGRKVPRHRQPMKDWKPIEGGRIEVQGVTSRRD